MCWGFFVVSEFFDTQQSKDMPIEEVREGEMIIIQKIGGGGAVF